MSLKSYTFMGRTVLVTNKPEIYEKLPVAKRMSDKKTYSELVALGRLKEIEKKNGGLINGNFSFVAHENKIKVKRIRELWEQEKNV